MEELFKTGEHFKGLSDLDRKILIESCTLKKVKKDEVLFKEGDKEDAAFIVKDGIVRITKKIPGNDDVILAIASRGMIFGEMAIFNITPRYADAIAVADTELIVLRKEKFNEIRKNHPETALAVIDIFITFLALYLRKTTDRVYGIFTKK